jgi:hypothetical protein
VPTKMEIIETPKTLFKSLFENEFWCAGISLRTDTEIRLCNELDEFAGSIINF